MDQELFEFKNNRKRNSPEAYVAWVMPSPATTNAIKPVVSTSTLKPACMVP